MKARDKRWKRVSIFLIRQLINKNEKISKPALLAIPGGNQKKEKNKFDEPYKLLYKAYYNLKDISASRIKMLDSKINFFQ